MPKVRNIQLMNKVLRTLVTRSLTIQSDSIPYHYENLSYKKIFNWIRTEAAIYLKRIDPWGWPTHVQLEPTSLCNLRCALCPVTTGLHRKTGNMEYELFKKFLDEVGDYLLLIMFWDWGEPLINPRIYEMIKLAKDRGIKTVTSTNAHLLANRENAEKLVHSGLDTLIVAIDGITQEAYTKYRKSGNVKTVIEGIRCVLEARKKIKTKNPLVNMRFIPMRHNEHELSKMINLATEMGVDVLSVKTLNPASNDMYNLNRDNRETNLEFLPIAPDLRRFHYKEDKDGPGRVRRHPFCKNPWNAPTVHWDGTISPCTYDYEERFPFGRLGEKTFKEIWFDAPYKEFRTRLRRKWPHVVMCGNCSYAFEGGSCWNETIAKLYYNQRVKELFSPDFIGLNTYLESLPLNEKSK
jgi:radical SAM protein with 4Fe4S-binding SPASM domain